MAFPPDSNGPRPPGSEPSAANPVPSNGGTALWELLILVTVGGGRILIYNSLVKLREHADAAWADIDVQLKRRHDLIPNLVETVRAYAGHEKETLERVIRSRSRAMDASGPARRAEAEEFLTDALRSLFALSESYPELRATENFRELQSTLAGLEDHIQRSGRYYNAVVRDFNTRTRQVPSNILARAFGFDERDFFRIHPEERKTPEVSLDEGSGS